MPRVGFEPMIPVFERAKTVHALDRAATVIGFILYTVKQNKQEEAKVMAEIYANTEV
jgi:hypothetical protein